MHKDLENSGNSIEKDNDAWTQLIEKSAQIELIFKIARHMMDIADTAAPITDPNSNNTIITDKNFVRDVALRLTGKPANNQYNQDADTTNDVYTADIAFSLGVRLLEGNGDSIVAILQDEYGNPKATIRIAGDPLPGEILCRADRSGRYTFRDVLLEEGEQGLRIVLKGTQHLRSDVYLFKSEAKDMVVNNKLYKDVTSQTMVTMAEGDHALEVEMSLLFSIEADDSVVRTERVWRRDNSFDPPPSTGDDSRLLFFALLFAGCAAAALCLRKRSAVR